MFLNEWDIRRHDSPLREKSSRLNQNCSNHRSMSLPADKVNYSVSGLKVLGPVNEWHQTAGDCHWYRLVHKSHRNHDNIASEMQKTQKKVAIYRHNQAFNSQDSFFVINFLTDFNKACDSSLTKEVAAACLFRKLMSSLALEAIKARLTLSLSNTNLDEGTIKMCDGVINHLSTRYATDLIIAKAYESIRTFKQVSLTPWYFSERL